MPDTFICDAAFPAIGRSGGRDALCAILVDIGQGSALVLERV